MNHKEEKNVSENLPQDGPYLRLIPKIPPKQL